MNKTFSTNIAGTPITVETGRMAQLANGSAMVRIGDTVVLSTATASKNPKTGIDFFPLSVEFEERAYAEGKIPQGGGKREGKPTDRAILASRMIDRPIRPLFPKDLRNDVNVNNLVLVSERDHLAEVAATIGTSVALSISDIPFNGPVGCVSLGRVNGEIVVNPTREQRKNSDMFVMLTGVKDRITMIEAKANEVPEDVMMKAVDIGQKEINKIVDFIEGIQKEIGKPKFEYQSQEIPNELFQSVKAAYGDRMREAVLSKDKQVREEKVDALLQECKQKYSETYPNQQVWLAGAITKLEKKIVRDLIFDESIRIDGRKIDEIRPLSADVAVLPRVHGTGLFSRGQTQVLTTVTLAPLENTQSRKIDIMESSGRYTHHYNFPGYATGEIKPSRGPGRREIGHGSLAEKALEPVLPSQEQFPYAIRAVSEVLMSNGSSSQASICASTLALMDAGVPIKNPVAGIAAGLITSEKDPEKFVTLTDLQGLEDFFGDMDFKVAGTKKGITAIQMDTKINGLSREMIQKALEVTKKGREQVIDNVILKTIAEPRKELAPTVPKANKELDVKPGEMYLGKVTRVEKYGAFVEIKPGVTGLVHISNLDKNKVDNVEDIVKVGDQIRVKVLEIDKRGKINLSRKDAILGLAREKSSADENRNEKWTMAAQKMMKSKTEKSNEKIFSVG